MKADISIPAFRNKIILIGGTSHCGKSTLAKFLVSQFNIDFISTDGLAKHPGRPWKEMPEMIPEHVVGHYSNLSVEEMIISVLSHYQNLWPTIRTKIEQKENEKLGVIIEGSALLPELVVNNLEKNILSFWLTASKDFLKHSIYKTSGFKEKTKREKRLIDKFVERTIAFDQLIIEQVKKFELLQIQLDGLDPKQGFEKDLIGLLNRIQNWEKN